MRTESQMFRLIKEIANKDERIRAVFLNGSRANSNVLPDPLQDYDIVYFVRELTSFKQEEHWIDQFGERLIMQMPEAMVYPQKSQSIRMVYLMQFSDGTRIDLTLYPIDSLSEFSYDSLTKVLIDKDQRFQNLADSSEKDYLPRRPDEALFTDCCNEFWWVSTYVAKGLWRHEITYAREMLDQVMRQPLMDMLQWYVGENSEYSVSIGKSGKHLQRLLPKNLWQQLLCTYSDAEVNNNWRALKSMCELFSATAQFVAEANSFSYKLSDEQNAYRYFELVSELPNTNC